MGAAAGSVAAEASAFVNAVKASGAILQVTPEDFRSVLARMERPLVVHKEGGLFSTNYQYATSYRGFVFFTKSPRPLALSSGVETIRAEKIWMPG
jgi:hypothetical protein